VRRRNVREGREASAGPQAAHDGPQQPLLQVAGEVRPRQPGEDRVGRVPARRAQVPGQVLGGIVHHPHAGNPRLQLRGENRVDLEREHQRVGLDVLGDQPGEGSRPRPQLDHGVGRREPHVLGHQLRQLARAWDHGAGAPGAAHERLQHPAVLAHRIDGLPHAARLSTQSHLLRERPAAGVLAEVYRERFLELGPEQRDPIRVVTRQNRFRVSNRASIQWRGCREE
jgi:hypothetical protein